MPTAMRALAVLLLAAAILGAGCLGAGRPAVDPEVPGEVLDVLEERPHVVIAIIDSGINPYHAEFADVPDAQGQAWGRLALPGFDAAQAVPLDLLGLHEDLNYDDAVDADGDLWKDIGRGQVVTLPGTKVVAAVSFDVAGLTGAEPRERVLDRDGHGTMTASRAAGNTISLGGPEVRLVVVQASLTVDELESARQAIEWVADQDWIDMVSNSWGLPAPTGPAGTPYTQWTDAIRDLAARKPTFFAAGNGLGNGLGPGYPSTLEDSLPEGVIVVGGHDNGRLVYWPNQMPHVVGDVARNPAAQVDDREEIRNSGGGTSSASPFVAGAGSRVLLEARRILDHRAGVLPDGVLAVAGPGAEIPASGPLADGAFSLDEFRTLLLHTAVIPQDDASDGTAESTSLAVPGQDALPTTLYPFFGYGEVNADTVAHAVQVLRGEADAPARPVEDALYLADSSARAGLYG